MVVLLLAVICLAAACSTIKNADSNTIPNRSDPKNDPVYFMAGRIEAGEKAAISSRISARVDSIWVELGSRVEKGSPLIQLDSGDLEAQVAQARAGVEEAQAAVAGAQVSQNNAKSTCDRYRELFSAGAVAKAQLDQTQAELEAADSAMNTAQARLNQAQASLQLASQQLSNSTLVSPISGKISAKNINSGELAVSGVPLLTVVNTDSLIINAYLPAGRADTINPGQKVFIKISEVAGKLFEGQVTAVDSVIDSKNGDVLVKVQVSERDPLLKPGMFAEIGIKNGGPSNE